VILQGNDERVVGWVVRAEAGDGEDGLLEVDWLAEGFIIESVGDDGFTAIVVDVHLHAFDPPFQVLHVPFYFGVAGELVAAEVGIVGGVAEVVCEGQALLDWLRLADVIGLLA
jgi:hypothetical protein